MEPVRMITFDVDPNTASGDYSAVIAITSNSDESPATNLDVSIALLAPAPNSLVACWSFDQDAPEHLGNHNGTLQNGATISTGGQGFGGGEALSLSGGSGVTAPHVTTANPESFDFNTDFTWHACVKSASAAGGRFGCAPANPVIHNQGSKSLFFGGGNVQWDTGWVGAPSPNVAMDDNEWHQRRRWRLDYPHH